MLKSDIQKLGSALDEVNRAIEVLGDPRGTVANRVAEIMAVASAADTSRASYNLGMIYEAMKPLRDLKTLEASKKRIQKELNAALTAEQDAATAGSESQDRRAFAP